MKFFTGVFASVSLLATSGLLSTQAANTDAITKGKLSYDFYCYQCHGYAGDAQTLASTYLNPPPRNFSHSSPLQLTTKKMLAAVTHGHEGTAMVSFSTILSKNDINNVVSYIRQHFMQKNKPDYIYHSKANGWPNHQRYADAFPFASGKLALDTPWLQLSESQKKGKKLFMSSCISCHDRAVVENEGPIWELRPLSYPRKHYDHRAPLDSISGASPYQLHEQIPDTTNMTKQQQRGGALFQQNCAFCHGGAATGKNWIGRFMEPAARDLTSDEITQRPDEQLLLAIRDGRPNTSMPAWKQVLNDKQINAIISYLKR
ncbi:c-type cytochrome [Cardiobacterium sp. AH-315-I02]|nr:c-type cytochrome [Cardiobacterium sp. AH-315-I02]